MSYEWLKAEAKLSPDEVFFRTLVGVEGMCISLDVDHRFVGGTVTDLFRPDTLMDVNPQTRVITLTNSNPPTVFRPGGRSVNDVDLVCFGQDRDTFHRVTAGFKALAEEARQAGYPAPYVSAESARWIDAGHRSGIIFLRDLGQHLRQWVTVFEVDPEGNLALAIDPVRQPISWASVEQWKIIAGDLTITTFNPIAHALCYRIRMPSGYKDKDLESSDVYGGLNKIQFLWKFAEEFARQYQEKTGVDIKEQYQSWQQYRQALDEARDGWTKVKRGVVGFYWKHGGTLISRGEGGKISQIISKWSNRFAGH